MKWTLAIDSSQANLIVGVFGDSLEDIRVEAEKKFDQIISSLIEELTHKHKLTSKPERVLFCLGPGSYTGTRSGLAFAQGYTNALGIPIVGVSAHLAFLCANFYPASLKFISELYNKRQSIIFVVQKASATDSFISPFYISGMLDKEEQHQIRICALDNISTVDTKCLTEYCQNFTENFQIDSTSKVKKKLNENVKASELEFQGIEFQGIDFQILEFDSSHSSMDKVQNDALNSLSSAENLKAIANFSFVNHTFANSAFANQAFVNQAFAKEISQKNTCSECMRKEHASDTAGEGEITQNLPEKYYGSRYNQLFESKNLQEFGHLIITKNFEDTLNFIEPIYVKGVNALTIEERISAKIFKKVSQNSL